MRRPPLWRLSHPLWQAPHRPFFLLAGLTAAVTPLVWLLPSGVGPEPIGWHRHELLFGMGAAGVGGYLMTALPAWTGQGPVRPWVTFTLTLLWLLARLTFAVGDGLPEQISTIGLRAYFFVLALILAVAIGKARAWKRLVLVVPVVLLGIAESGTNDDLTIEAGSLTPPLILALLISIVGGRAVPAFTRHWIERAGICFPFRDHAAIGSMAIVILIAAQMLIIFDCDGIAGVLIILSGIMQFMRMPGWGSWLVHRDSALLLLHLAWLWLSVGLMLCGLSLLLPSALALASALHGLTMGAMGSMMLAVMARAAATRKNGVLLLGRAMRAGFVCVFVSASIRVLASSIKVPIDTIPLAALVWMVGWMLFIKGFLPALHGPVPRPVLSGSSKSIATQFAA